MLNEYWILHSPNSGCGVWGGDYISLYSRDCQSSESSVTVKIHCFYFLKQGKLTISAEI